MLIRRGTGGQETLGPPEIGFPSNTGPDPLKKNIKNRKANIQCWAIIGTPVMKRHLNYDGGPLFVVFGSSTKNMDPHI